MVRGGGEEMPNFGRALLEFFEKGGEPAWDGERAGDGAVVGNNVESLSGDGDAEVGHLL